MATYSFDSFLYFLPPITPRSHPTTGTAAVLRLNIPTSIALACGTRHAANRRYRRVGSQQRRCYPALQSFLVRPNT